MTSEYTYNFTISFAEEDRTIASGIALALELYKVDSYYYPDHQERMVGGDIYEELNEIYERDSKYAIIIISEHYLGKKFTSHEYKAIKRRWTEQKDYAIPVKVGDVDLTRLDTGLENIVYFEWCSEFKPLVQSILIKKLGLSAEDLNLSKEEKKVVYQNAKTINNIRDIGDSTITF